MPGDDIAAGWIEKRKGCLLCAAEGGVFARVYRYNNAEREISYWNKKVSLKRKENAAV